MNNNKVQNPEQAVPKNQDMNDCDYLNDILTTEKNMSNNYSIALNEVSNDQLYNELFKIFSESKQCARDLFNLSFKKGWYKLEKAEAQKIKMQLQEHQAKVKELPS